MGQTTIAVIFLVRTASSVMSFPRNIQCLNSMLWFQIHKLISQYAVFFFTVDISVGKGDLCFWTALKYL